MTGSGDVVLAFDFGLRRIGIASGNLLTQTASPLTTIIVGRELPWTEIDRVIDDWRPSLLVVGMPTANETGTGISADVGAFVTELKDRYALAVVTVDESLTSGAAHAALKEGRRSGFLRRRIGKERIDRHAACLIAEQWLNELRHEP